MHKSGPRLRRHREMAIGCNVTLLTVTSWHSGTVNCAKMSLLSRPNAAPKTDNRALSRAYVEYSPWHGQSY